MNEKSRSKAIEKFIKHSRKYRLGKNIDEYKSSMEYGVINGKYLTDMYCLVYTKEDLSSYAQSENECSYRLSNLLKERKNMDNIVKSYKVNLNKLFDDIKQDGFKDTFKQENEEKILSKYTTPSETTPPFAPSHNSVLMFSSCDPVVI